MTQTYPEWVIDYLQYIDAPADMPSLQYLTTLTIQHLTHIPFENISTFLQYHEYHKQHYLPKGPERFVRALYTQHTGGTCYVLNSVFGELLTALGFQTRYIVLGGSHLALLVQLPGDPEAVYVDVGNGSPFFKPVHLESDPENVSAFGNIKVLLRPGEGEGKYKYYRYANGKPMIWDFDTKVDHQYDDLQPLIKHYFQRDGLFTSSLRCQVFQLDQNRSLSLVNNVLNIHYRSGETEKHILSSIDEIKAVMEDEFRFPKMPVDRALSVLKTLDIDIFRTKKESR